MSEHEHVWKLQMHVDGCHFFASTYSCECGARRTSTAERNATNDPFSMVWMREDGEGCERCVELLAGAEPKYSDEIEVPA